MALDPTPSRTSNAWSTAAVTVYVTAYVPSPLSRTTSVSSAPASPAFFFARVFVCEAPPVTGVHVSVTVRSDPPTARPTPSASAASIVNVARSPATARSRPSPAASNIAGVAAPAADTAFNPRYGLLATGVPLSRTLSSYSVPVLAGVHRAEYVPSPLSVIVTSAYPVPVDASTTYARNGSPPETA